MLLFALLISAVNGLAVFQVRHRLSTTSPETIDHPIGDAVARYSAFGVQRTLEIAAVLVAAGLVWSVLGWAVWRGRLRRPGAIAVPAGVLVAMQVFACFIVYEVGPVSGFTDRPNTRITFEAYVTDEANPAWYQPTLTVLLVLSLIAQIAAVAVLSGKETAGWVCGPAALCDTRADLRARCAGGLLVCTLGFAAAYVIVTAIAIEVAMSAAPEAKKRPGPRELGYINGSWSVHMENLHLSVLFAIWAVPLTVCGVVLLRYGASLATMVVVGALSPFYAATMWMFVSLLTMDTEDASPLLSYLPHWREPVLHGFRAGAIGCQLLALTILACCPIRQRTQRSEEPQPEH
ncbi:hypothetical protein [Actinomadura opuntiae]|uniref:hypothetical protein n=1 Tax=Actinomadura sp. OS1-43 TaxID=604315 RepID=UPI00255AC474|nr:hypothetical protein [Actinomadura sp. OS1-43]MDL4814154.1 hypothetical protein [Actinomadura sp. OS1-43]